MEPLPASATFGNWWANNGPCGLVVSLWFIVDFEPLRLDIGVEAKNLEGLLLLDLEILSSKELNGENPAAPGKPSNASTAGELGDR